jgi:hypothetical protein
MVSGVPTSIPGIHPGRFSKVLVTSPDNSYVINSADAVEAQKLATKNSGSRIRFFMMAAASAMNTLRL